MELLANVSDPRIPLSLILLRLGLNRPQSSATRPQRIAPSRAVRIEIPARDARETFEEPERWDGLS